MKPKACMPIRDKQHFDRLDIHPGKLIRYMNISVFKHNLKRT